MKVDQIEAELASVRAMLEAETNACTDAMLLVSKLERAITRIGAHHAEDQKLLREARAVLRAKGWRVSSGLYAPTAPPWANDPPPWSKEG